MLLDIFRVLDEEILFLRPGTIAKRERVACYTGKEYTQIFFVAHHEEDSYPILIQINDGSFDSYDPLLGLDLEAIDFIEDLEVEIDHENDSAHFIDEEKAREALKKWISP